MGCYSSNTVVIVHCRPECPVITIEEGKIVDK
jgi:hypothetical protein